MAGVLYRGAQCALRKNLQNWQQFETVVISGPPLHSHCARARDPTSTIIITPGEVESPLPRDRCGVTAISIILPTLLYVSNVVVSPRTNNKESLRRPAGREREREKKKREKERENKCGSKLKANEPTVLQRLPVCHKATCFFQMPLTIFNSTEREHRSSSTAQSSSSSKKHRSLLFQSYFYPTAFLQSSFVTSILRKPGSIQPCVILWCIVVLSVLKILNA